MKDTNPNLGAPMRTTQIILASLLLGAVPDTASACEPSSFSIEVVADNTPACLQFTSDEYSGSLWLENDCDTMLEIMADPEQCDGCDPEPLSLAPGEAASLYCGAETEIGMPNIFAWEEPQGSDGGQFELRVDYHQSHCPTTVIGCQSSPSAPSTPWAWLLAPALLGLWWWRSGLRSIA